MTTKKRAATTKSKKTSKKRSTAKTGLSRSGLSVKDLTNGRTFNFGKRDKITSDDQVVIIAGKKFKVVEVTPAKRKVKVQGLVDMTKDDQAKGSKKKTLTPRGASSTAPVVYQTLREKVAAVEKNIGKTQSLKDFLDSAGWR